MHATFMNGEVQVSCGRIIPWQGLCKSRHLHKAQSGLEVVPVLVAQGGFPHVGHKLDHDLVGHGSQGLIFQGNYAGLCHNL